MRAERWHPPSADRLRARSRFPASRPFPEKLKVIHAELGALLAQCRPDCVAIENLFHAVNARSALKLGHARGVAMLAAVEAGVPIVEYTPAEVKQAVVGYGRAEKGQVQSMIQLLLGLTEPPTPFDAADALAIAVCHLHRMNMRGVRGATPRPTKRRAVRPAAGARSAQPRRAGVGPRANDMIAHLRGRLLEKQPNRLIVDVNGVGYDVHVPLSTFYEMAEPGADVTLRIHTHVREDALLLYGFATRLELQIFERLISVSGIGPKLALAVLSGLEPNELVAAIRTANVARLTGIPGIGKKTAERIGLELKDKMASFAPVENTAPPIDDSEALRTDLLSALMNLGYHRPLAERAVSDALRKTDSAGFEATLKLALRELAK